MDYLSCLVSGIKKKSFPLLKWWSLWQLCHFQGYSVKWLPDIFHQWQVTSQSPFILSTTTDPLVSYFNCPSSTVLRFSWYVETKIVCGITGACFLCFYTRVEESFQCYSPAPSWRCLLLWGILDRVIYGKSSGNSPITCFGIIHNFSFSYFLSNCAPTLLYSYTSPLLKFIYHFLPVYTRCVN